MNENVKQNQPVSLFSFLILRVAGLLNSADFSRSCTSSSCNISLSFSSSALTQARRRRRLFPIACLDSRLSSLTPPTVPKCLAILGRWKTRSCILGATLPLKTLGNTVPTSRQRVSRRSSSFSSRAEVVAAGDTPLGSHCEHLASRPKLLRSMVAKGLLDKDQPQNKPCLSAQQSCQHELQPNNHAIEQKYDKKSFYHFL